MRRGHPKIVRNEVIEQVTESRIRQYEAMSGKKVTFPIPIDKIIEKVLKLDFDYDEIEEQPGEQILGALDVEARKILVNSKHSELFQRIPGLERSTIGHEAGHWDMDIDRAHLLHPTLPGMETKSHVVPRHGKKADRFLEVLLRRAMNDQRAYRLYKQVTAGQDPPEVRSLVDRYQSALLMPAWLIREAAEKHELCNWPYLYDLQEAAQVTISNLTTRLQRLKLIYIPKGDKKKIYRSQEEFLGMKSLFD